MGRQSRCAVPVLVLVLLACGEREGALRVGDVVFSEDQVGRLPPELVRSQADVASMGLAIARGEVREVVEPLALRGAQRARLAHLPWLLAARELELDEAQLRSAYDADPEWELSVRHLVRLVPRRAAEAERQRARARVEEARRRALAGEDFVQLVEEYSEEPGAAERGGLLRPGRENSWVEPFWRAALALEPGQLSPVVETEYGFHLIRLEGRDPVRFEDADAAAALRRVIPEPQATAAMQRWLEQLQESLQIDRPDVLTARAQLEAGDAPDTLVLARWTATAGARTPGRYTARDLMLFRASLDGEELERLDRASSEAYVGRVLQDAREAMWAQVAADFGAPASERAAEETRLTWQARSGRWAEALGFRRGMGSAEIQTASVRALASRGQEAQIARLELVGLRPLLWARYGVSGRSLTEPRASSSSRARKSARTG